ncbi:MAG: TetR/AcrR family transcriptional regulator [Acidimicrobiales bacterium]
MEPRTPVRQSGVDTRARILEVSLTLFMADSFKGTSVRDIAENVGVTQPTLYYHFGSKDGILAVLVEPLIDAGEVLLGELAAVSVSRKELADRALKGYYDLIVEHLDVFQFVETDRSVRSHPDAGHRLADQATRFLQMLAGSDRHRARIGAAAALGAVRRPLRLAGIDPGADRTTILRCANAALSA